MDINIKVTRTVLHKSLFRISLTLFCRHLRQLLGWLQKKPEQGASCLPLLSSKFSFPRWESFGTVLTFSDDTPSGWGPGEKTCSTKTDPFLQAGSTALVSTLRQPMQHIWICTSPPSSPSPTSSYPQRRACITATCCRLIGDTLAPLSQLSHSQSSGVDLHHRAARKVPVTSYCLLTAREEQCTKLRFIVKHSVQINILGKEL